MGLVLGIVAALVTFGFVFFIFFASSMSDNREMSEEANHVGLWSLALGLLISGILIFTHYFPLHW